jgi:hypothetical protein
MDGIDTNASIPCNGCPSVVATLSMLSTSDPFAADMPKSCAYDGRYMLGT